MLININLGDFYDTYENLPLKTYLGYQFYNDHCQNHAGLVQFIDDDTFVRFDEMEKILMDSEQVVCLKGFPIDNYAVSYVGKYYVWVDQWPSRYRVPKPWVKFSSFTKISLNFIAICEHSSRKLLVLFYKT